MRTKYHIGFSLEEGAISNKAIKSISQSQKYLKGLIGTQEIDPLYLSFGHVYIDDASEKIFVDKVHGLLEGIAESIPKSRGFIRGYDIIKEGEKSYVSIKFNLYKDDNIVEAICKVLEQHLQGFVRNQHLKYIKLIGVSSDKIDKLQKQDEKGDSVIMRIKYPPFFFFNRLDLFKISPAPKMEVEIVDKVALSGKL